MRKSTADSPLMVSTDGRAGPYVVVPSQQLRSVIKAFQTNEIRHQVDPNAVLIDGRPALVVLDLGHDANLAKIQSVLETVAAEREIQRNGCIHRPDSHHELIVRCSPRDFEGFVQRIEATPPGGWNRRNDIEVRSVKIRAAVGAYCFSKQFQFVAHFESVIREVAVWLQKRGLDELYVSTILPLQGRAPLTVEQYNQVLGDFSQTFIESLGHGLGVHVFDYEAFAEPALDDLLSVEALRRLKSFSTTANRTSLHSLDLQRWHAFVAQTHRDELVLDSTLLSNWLHNEGWSEDLRIRLVEQYELGRSFLTVYDEELADK